MAESLNLEPNWPGVLRWAENGLKSTHASGDIGAYKNFRNIINMIDLETCNEPFFCDGRAIAICTELRYSEHSHHDRDVADAVAAGLARAI